MKLKKNIKIDETNIDLETVVNNCIYSTKEKIVGKWIDGKFVYQKTIIGTYADNVNILTNVDTLIDYKGTAEISGLPRAIPYCELFNNQSYWATIRLRNHNVETDFLSSGQAVSSYIKLTLKYTKTTD